MTPALQERQADNDKPLVIWRLTDGKPGHENQSLGLCRALERLMPAVRHDIPADGRLSSGMQWLTGRFPAGEGLPPADLILGAGHQTHPALLAARRAYGGRTVVIMKPSLPLGLFDLCVIPEHDRVSGENVFVTRGAMNSIIPGGSAVDTETVCGEAIERGALAQTLLLLGGPSRHYAWQDELIINQVETIVQQQPEGRFLLSDSRRTPPGCMEKIAALQLANLTLIPWQETGPGWVAEQLSLSRNVWVSEDSVSMVYEAITSGAAVGLITVERKHASRISTGVRQLMDSGWATSYRRWRETGSLSAPAGRFNEAERCAEWMVEEWLTKR